jgi:hypothetical protein
MFVIELIKNFVLKGKSMQNSASSIYLEQGGNVNRIINGQSVQPLKDTLAVAGSQKFEFTVTVDGITIHQDINGNFFLVQNGQYVPISLADLKKLDAERFGGQLPMRIEQELSKPQEKPNYALYVGVVLVVILLLKG